MCQKESSQNCVNCCQAAYATGSTDFFKDIANCLCVGGSAPCATACAAADDYCGTPGDATSTKCNNCLNTYLAAGAQCDPASGTIASTCAADPQCSAYTTCSNPCP
jgi:hypothetical protein